MSAIKARAIQRGRLLERITQQRATIANNTAPIREALSAADQVVAGAERARRWIHDNPLAVGAGLFVLVLWRPKGALKLVKNGVLGWRTWRLIRQKLGVALN